MGIDRKAISNALLALANGAKTFNNQNQKRFKFIDEVTPAELPALYLTWDGDQVTQHQNFAGENAVETYMLHIYEDGGNDPTTVPVDNIMDTVKLIEDALKGKPDGFRQTLGGLVESCVIEGSIKTDAGMLGSKSFAMIPVRVVATD